MSQPRLDGPNSGQVLFDVSYGYKSIETFINRVDMRAKSGSLFTYIDTGEYRRFELPLQWVSNSDRAVINSWWSTGVNLQFLENDTYTNSYFEVRIIGNEEPFQSFVAPYYQVYYEGQLTLETI